MSGIFGYAGQKPADFKVEHFLSCLRCGGIPHNFRENAFCGLGPSPYSDRAGHILLFSGEIYNLVELQNKLLITTYNDEPVILLQLLLDYGEKILPDLRGSFALAFWQEQRQSLLLARDPLGIKSLFFLPLAEQILFASECRALSHFTKFVTDTQIIYEYLFFGHALANNTLYDKVQELLPGEYLYLDKNMLAISQRYFYLGEFLQLADRQNRDYRFTAQPLLDTVNRHIHGCNTSALCLSGGLDSTSLAIALKENSHLPHCVSLAFSQAEFDESVPASQFAIQQGLNWQKVVFPTEREELKALVLKALMAMDGPFGDASFVPTYQLASFVATFQNVAFSGTGGDELFYGYPTFMAEAMLNWLPTFCWPFLAYVAEKIGRPATGRVDLKEKIWRFGQGLAQQNILSRQAIFMSFGSEKLYPFANFLALCQKKIIAEATEEGCLEGENNKLLFYYYFRLSLAKLGLLKIERAFAEHNLLMRHPFLDLDFIQKTFRFPPWNFPFLHQSKAYLRFFWRQYVKCRYFGSKKGFSAPLAHILPVLADLIYERHGLKIPSVLLQSPYRYFSYNLLTALFHEPHSLELQCVLERCSYDS